MADIDNNQNAENTQLPAEFNDSTEMNLADMLSALIESTIAADQKAAEDYLDVLRTYALEPANGSNGHERLKMVDFEMTDSNGREQIVSIPKLSLLPLPLLRVAEATFDIEAQIDISTATKQDVEKFEENYPIYNQKKNRRPQQGRTRNTAEENQVACRYSCTTWQPTHAEKEKSFATQRKDYNERNHLDAEDDEREGAHKTRTGAAARRHARSATSHREHYQGGG